ncbi:MAG: hypothetical protein JW984_10915 [Deltaproteobacteria bacterium]|uniref:Uncharacterized protein n=1 Tax=Candidatus Zymogenus saltonus TaxID=2844893 RepID=A0A9D8PNW7_9DELT|nr:hypothetical protein [Candidatus Zymogenus saltonus]
MKKGKEKSMERDKASKGMDKDILDSGSDDDMVIPLCFGELSRRDAEGIKELWEKTWSADSRFSRKSKGDDKD